MISAPEPSRHGEDDHRARCLLATAVLYLRVDAAETALARSGAEVGVGGYAVVHELAVASLLVGNTALLHLEVVLPDEAEHRRRVTTRRADLTGS